MQQKLEQFYSSLWPQSLLAYVPAQPVYAEHVQISWSLPDLAKKMCLHHRGSSEGDQFI